MRSISETIDRLKRLAPAQTAPSTGGRLVSLGEFGTNPGDLDAFGHVPADLEAGSPLVVVLHGCTQSAQGYDQGSGWTALADACGFAVLFAQQRRTNNPNLCFNWFAPEDARRNGGEAASIAQMTRAFADRHRCDFDRIFVTGLSAGGAMTSVMLATYPDLFAGGAIIAGLPFAVATSVPEAFSRMRGQGYDGLPLAASVRNATAHHGRWPTVAIWHGTGDATVHVANAERIVEQWRDLHGVGAPVVTDVARGHRHRAWHDAEGRLRIEEHLIDGMGHGTPLGTTGDEGYGAAGPFMLDVGISSTYRIAASWGIAPMVAPKRRAAPVAAPAERAGFQAAMFDPSAVIDDALRAAGLLKR